MITTIAAILLAAASAAAASAPNVVFLSVDTLRAGHLGCYGYELDTSPNLDALAAESLVFDDAVCEIPLTFPSFGAMLTSRYPRETGTVRNGLRMPSHVPIVPELFRQAGYQTFCVQSNWTLKADLSGLNRGFEVYHDDFDTKRWGVIKGERIAEDITDTALDLLEKRAEDKPLFCWIHYSDPHAPYNFHVDFNPAGKTPGDLGKAGDVRVRYDSEVAYCDHHIGRLLAGLPKENTYILFVADHGESLYEHGVLGHGRRIYQPGMHIPLFIRGPGIEQGRKPAPVRGIDIGPTLLGLAGLPVPGGMLGTDLLAPDLPPQRPRVVETYGGAVPNIPGAEALMAGRPPQRIGVIQRPWKLIIGGDVLELYHLTEDPGELDNRALNLPGKARELAAIVEEWEAAHPRDHIAEKRAAEEVELTDEDIDALRNLGYVGD